MSLIFLLDSGHLSSHFLDEWEIWDVENHQFQWIFIVFGVTILTVMQQLNFEPNVDVHFGGGGSNPFFAHPQILISMCLGGKMCKNGEKSIWKEREKVIVLANCWYFIIIIFGILIIKQDFSCNILHDLVMTLSS